MRHLTQVVDMYIIRAYWITFLIVLFTSCSKSSPHISIGCEENVVGNNIIKWETTPRIEGYVRIYAGNTPHGIVEDIPVGMAKIDDQRIVIINNDPTKRQFYSVVFNNDSRQVVGSRNINIPNVQNFRDLGGYRVYSIDKGGKWGKVYRTGNLDDIDQSGISRLKNLHVKTIVDLRPIPEQKKNQLIANNFKMVSIPIFCKDSQFLLDLIKNKEITRSQIKEIMKDVYIHLIRDNKEQYKQVFTLLLDETNYPIVFQCPTGKEQAGIISYLLLTSLGVNDETARLDYLRSNQFLDISEAYEYASNLSNNAQEALTALVLAQEEYINASIQEIKSSYGNVESFLMEGLGFSERDLDKLRSMLLE